MRKLSALLLSLPLVAAAQTTWNVDVGGSLFGGTPPYYEPADLVIQQGDIVHWNAAAGSSGEHNVYGEADVFPDNPEPFGSGNTQEPPWDYSHTFNIPGFYEYHCTQEDHAATQFGTITVLDANGLMPERKSTAITLFPVPAEDQVVLSLNGCTGAVRAKVLTSDGRVVRQQAVSDGKPNVIDLSGLPSGQYFMYVDRGVRSRVLPFVKR